MASIDDQTSIAIIGIGCRFAGCSDLKAFWTRVLMGQSAFSSSPDPDASHFLGRPNAPFGRVTTLQGGYLRDLWQVNPASIDLPTSALQGTNPEIPLATELASQAMRNANLTGKTAVSHDRMGLTLGYSPQMDCSTVNWCQQGLVVDQTLDLIRRCFPHGSTEEFEILRENLLTGLPTYDSRNITSLFHHTIVMSIASRLDLCGPVYCVNGGGISSQLAIQSACDELISNRADMMLSGAIQGPLNPQSMMPCSKMGLLSKSDAMHPYGRDADGLLLGEGGGFLVLKRQPDALRDGDRIYATIRSTGISASGNKKKASEAFPLATKSALRQKDIQFRSLGLIEGDGSSIPSLDRLEVKSLTGLFEDFATFDVSTVALGSAKGLIGDCGAAAGMAGTIKAALALHHRIIPPSQEARTPAEQLRLAETPFYLNLSPRPWVHDDAGLPRRAGIASLAIGGGASFLVLEQAAEDRS